MTNHKKISSDNLSTHNGAHADSEHAENVAILFTDMQGSSDLYKTRGNMAGRIMIQKLNDLLFPVIIAHNGKVIKTIGDSIMSSFLIPGEALMASVVIQKKLEAYNKDCGFDERFLIRVAMNYGHGIIEKDDVFGDVVNVAAKLVSCCNAGQIIITEPFYLAAKDVKEVSFSPYEVSGKENLESNLYLVDWEKVKEAATCDTYLLSLKIEAPPDMELFHESIEKVLLIIKQNADRVADVKKKEINAIFTDVKTCFKAAQKAVQNYINLFPADNGPAGAVQIGIHAINKSTMEDSTHIQAFSKAVNARDNAGSCEIVLTPVCHRSLPPDLQKFSTQKPNTPNRKNPFYTFQWQNKQKQELAVAALLPEKAVDQNAARCFYCGTNMHATNRCPSKLIRKPTSCLDRLGYIPLDRVRLIFHDKFSDFVEPLNKVADEKRFDVLFKEDKIDPYSLCFFAFYETLEFFQLRSMHQLFLEDSKDGDKQSKKTGALLMGEDCLSVSKFNEAGEWFEKARAQQVDDYRAYICLGMLFIEKDDHEKAHSYFNTAMSYAITNTQKRYIHLLTARLYEYSGALDYARQEVEKALSLFQNWGDGSFYLAVILVKSGEIKRAIGIFKNLIYLSPRYYLMLSLYPDLDAARDIIIPFLDEELANLRSKAESSFNNINATIEPYSKWLTVEDKDYKTALELMQKASGYLQKESISGLMDIPGMEANISLLLNRAISFRQNYLKKKLSAIERNIDNFSKYLAAFPYKSLLSRWDFRLNENIRKLIETAHIAADETPPPDLKRSKALMGSLSKECEKLESTMDRLEVMKMSCFAMECSVKIAGVFFVSLLLTVFVITFFLTLYHGFAGSFSSLAKADFTNYLKFSFFMGLFSGIISTATWLKNNFREMHKKIDI